MLRWGNLIALVGASRPERLVIESRYGCRTSFTRRQIRLNSCRNLVVRETLMGTVSTRILVVDDYEPWHAFVSNALKKQPQLEIVAQACDGLEAVQRAEQLKPDLILLDIGLPMLNGIEAARRIREVSPTSKILFVSE